MTESLPQQALERLARERPSPGSRPVFTSDLSVNEFLLVREAGFRPLGLVMGSSVYHVGLQLGRWSRNQELTTLTQAMYHARELAMERMTAEAEVLDADGIVGVRLEIHFRDAGGTIAEFLAIGTAVVGDRADSGQRDGWRTSAGRPFTSDLSGQDFWTLLRAGYAPLGLVMGTCVYHLAHQKAWQKLGTTGRNIEIPQFTEAVYEARELAASRMQAEADALSAEGVVGVELRALPHHWGGHTTEFFAVGTAIGSLRDDHTVPPPSLVVPLTD